MPNKMCREDHEPNDIRWREADRSLRTIRVELERTSGLQHKRLVNKKFNQQYQRADH